MQTTPHEVSFRVDPLRNLFDTVKVDREEGVLYGTRIMELGEAKGHGVLIDDTTLSLLVQYGQQAGKVKSRFGHPGMSNTALGTYLGLFHNVRLSNNMVIGDLHLDKKVASSSPSGNLYEYILNLAESAPTQAGASVVVPAHYVWKGTDGMEYFDEDKPSPDNLAFDKPFLRPVGLSAVDIVDEPAATSSMFDTNVFFDPAIVEGRDSALAQSVFAQIDSWLEKVNVPPSRAWEFADRYFTWRVGGQRSPESVTLTGRQLLEVKEKMSTKEEILDDTPVAITEPASQLDTGKQQDEFSLIADAVLASDERVAQLQSEVDQLMLAFAEMQTQLAQLEMLYNAEPVVTNTLSAHATLPSQQAERLRAITNRTNTVGSIASKSAVETPKLESKKPHTSRIPGVRGVDAVSMLRISQGYDTRTEVL